jgi:hypothetical protein
MMRKFPHFKGETGVLLREEYEAHYLVKWSDNQLTIVYNNLNQVEDEERLSVAPTCKYPEDVMEHVISWLEETLSRSRTN